MSVQKPEYGKSRALVAALLLVGVATLVALAPGATATAVYQPPELKNGAVQSATLQVALEYANAAPGLDAKTLRWYLYAIEHRESTFSTTFCNYNDGAGSWNSPIGSSSWPTSDHLPHGCGLTQLTGWTHSGMPYPGNSGSSPSTSNKGIYGTITLTRPVTPLSDPFDPVQNLRRFMSEEVLPDYLLIQKAYPGYNTEQLLRAVAFHWNKGEYQSYQPSNCDYLCLYDQYVNVYKAAVLADGAWLGGGSPAPAPAPAPTSAPTPVATSPGTAAFTLGPNVNEWWIEVSVPGASAVSASVNGGSAVPLTLASWGKWTTSTHVVAGSRVVFAATVNGASATSPTFAWLGAASPVAAAPAPIAVAAPPTSSPAPSGTATFAVSPNINSWWIEVKVSPTATAVTASVNGGTPMALRATSWGSWAVSAPVPHGAQVGFVATVGGGPVASGITTWT